MCLIAFAWRAAPGYALVVAANRDEFHARPTAPAAFWDDVPALFAGRDLQDGGSWMGVARDGRFAALTNHRDPGAARVARRSRGHLVADFLRSHDPASGYAQAVAGQRGQYNGFNLLAGDARELWYVANDSAAARPVEPGFHALSNARLDTAWPKAIGLAGALESALGARRDEDALVADLFAALADPVPPPDALLPDTGVGLARERVLGARRIVDPVYGTRSSAVLLWRDDGSMRYDELGYDPAGHPAGRVSQAITPSGAAPA